MPLAAAASLPMVPRGIRLIGYGCVLAQDKEAMLKYVSKEVDRLKELFRGKEVSLKEERDALATSLQACQAQLAEVKAAHQDCGRQAAEAAQHLKVALSVLLCFCGIGWTGIASLSRMAVCMCGDAC